MFPKVMFAYLFGYKMVIIYTKKSKGIPNTPYLKTKNKIYKIVLSTIEDVEQGMTTTNHAVGFIHGLSKMDNGNVRAMSEWEKIIKYIKGLE